MTLAGDEWLPELGVGATGLAISRQLILGLRARREFAAGQELPSTEPLGWDAVVQPQLDATGERSGIRAPYGVTPPPR